MDLLERLLEGGSAGSPQMLFVSGEPGIGKSSLLDELLLRAQDRGFLALRGSAAELERELPFGLSSTPSTSTSSRSRRAPSIAWPRKR